MVVGQDDVHLVHDSSTGVMPAPASAVISTRIKPGQENAYRRWERKIGAVQAMSPGFQGYRFEPPVPGVQNDWLTILKFDSEANLQTWLSSTERNNLLEQAAGGRAVRAVTLQAGVPTLDARHISCRKDRPGEHGLEVLVRRVPRSTLEQVHT
jgi:hypothetical protein